MVNDATAIRMSRRTSLLVGVTSVIGLVGFLWPLLAQPTGSANLAHAADAPWIFMIVVPLMLAVVISEVAAGGIDAKALALLGVLAGCGAALRIAGSGISGFEAAFFLLIPAGRVFGRSFGFVLGAFTLLVSALVTGGVGPWLPFQMFGAAWIGFGAGCLPVAKGRAEVGMLAAYGAITGLAYGLLLNMWFWPYATSMPPAISFVSGDPVGENLRRFWAFHLATSLGWDIPRAITNVVLMMVAGPAVLLALRRAGRRAAFGAAVTFTPSTKAPAPVPSEP